MAWNKIDTNFWTHKKTKVLACELGVHPAQAAGHVGRLWAWAINSAVDGEMSVPDVIIADSAGWEGKPEFFVQALINAGFLDDDYDGHRRLHDWNEWTGALVRRREEDRKRMKKMRDAQSERRRNGIAGPPPPHPRHYME